MRPIPGIRSAAIGLMRERNFRVIWSVGILAEFGRRYEILALSLLILDITNFSPAHLMLLWVFNNLPRPFVSSLAGYVADRFSRQRVMFLVQATNIATTGGLLGLMLYGLDALQTWHIFVAAFIQGTTKAIEDPSRRTGIFDIVGRDRLVNAMSLDVISQNVGKMIGPVIGGLLIQFSGYPVAYIFLLFVHIDNLWLISRLRIPETGFRAAMPPLWRGLGEAFHLALKTRMLVGMLSITIVMNALALPTPAVHSGSGTGTAGSRTRAGRGAGGGRRVRPSRWRGCSRRDAGIRYHGRYFTYGSIVVLLALVAYVWSPWYGVAFILLFVSGLGQAGFSTMQSSIMMLVSPPAMRGQMMGAFELLHRRRQPAGGIRAQLRGIRAVPATNNIVARANRADVAASAMVFTPLIWQPLTLPDPSPAT